MVGVPAPTGSTTSPPPGVGEDAAGVPLGGQPFDDLCDVVHELPGASWMQQLAATDYPARVAEVRDWPAELGASAPTRLCATVRKRWSLGPDETLSCYAQVPRGAGDVWVVVVRTDPTESQGGTAVIAHATPSGEIARGGDAAWSTGGDPAAPGGGQPTTEELVAILDYDGDGSSEAITVSQRSTDAAGNLRQDVRIWSARGGKVVPYPPAAGLRLVGLVDQDQDGRPDPVVDPHDATVGSAFGWQEGHLPWTLLAHALPDGRFSLDDRVARSYARWLCPVAPDVPNMLDGDPACWAGAVHCANLWGAPAAAVARRLEGACREPASDEQVAAWCDGSLGTWIEMARRPLPFRLRR